MMLLAGTNSSVDQPSLLNIECQICIAVDSSLCVDA